jgi:carbon storage regulator CsrA
MPRITADNSLGVLSYMVGRDGASRLSAKPHLQTEEWPIEIFLLPPAHAQADNLSGPAAECVVASSRGGFSMMVVNRRLGQEIVINGNIRITVVKIRGSQIVLGLTAPASIRIHRLEGMSPNEAKLSAWTQRFFGNLLGANFGLTPSGSQSCRLPEKGQYEDRRKFQEFGDFMVDKCGAPRKGREASSRLSPSDGRPNMKLA